MTKALPLLLVAGTLVLAGCGKTRDVLPPEAWQPAPAQPQSGAIDQPGTVPPPEPVRSTALAGSQAALVEAAGSDTILFPFDSYGLDEKARQTLGAQAEWLGRNPGVRVSIEGHTDERGTREYNLALGERRGNAVREYLISLGVGGDRLLVVSKGEESPLCFAEHESCWQQNRRGHFIITAK